MWPRLKKQRRAKHLENWIKTGKMPAWSWRKRMIVFSDLSRNLAARSKHSSQPGRKPRSPKESSTSIEEGLGAASPSSLQTRTSSRRGAYHLASISGPDDLINTCLKFKLIFHSINMSRRCKKKDSIILCRIIFESSSRLLESAEAVRPLAVGDDQRRLITRRCWRRLYLACHS